MSRQKVQNPIQLQKATVDGMSGAIGLVVIHDVYGVREDRTSVLAKMTAAGLDPKYLVEKKDKSAFLETVRNLEEDRIITKVDDPYAHVTYQISATEFQEALAEGGLPTVTLSRHAVVRFYKPGRGPKAGTIESDVPGIADAVQALMLADKNMVRTPDVTRAIERIIKAANGGNETINLKTMGGVWYCPCGLADTLSKIEVWTNGINRRGSGRTPFLVLPMADQTKNRVAVFQSVKDDIQSSLSDLTRRRDSLKKIIAASEAGTEDAPKFPAGALEGVLHEFKLAKEKVLAFADFLALSGDSVIEQIKEQEAAFKADLLGM